MSLTPCVCVRVCTCSGGAVESPSLRVLGEGQEEAAAKSEQMTELPASFSSAPRPMWQVSSVNWWTEEQTSPPIRCVTFTEENIGFFSQCCHKYLLREIDKIVNLIMELTITHTHMVF